MTKIYCIICGNYTKFNKSWNIIHFQKNVLFIICSKYNNEDEKIFKNKESIETNPLFN